MARPMKDSGVEWIGSIPKEWDMVPARLVFTEVRDINENGLVQTALKFKSGTIIPKSNFDSSDDDYVAETITNYTIVDKGDVVVNGLNLNYDLKSLRVGLVRERGAITSAYLALRPLTEHITSMYAVYLLKGYETRMALHNMGYGIRKTLGFKEFKIQPILLPSIGEQNRIVRFLDDKCSAIDDVLAKTQESIEEYKKLKQAVINETVVKGVRGKRLMKDSGIDWIGQIPKDWNVVKITRILDDKHPYAIGDGDHGLISPSDYVSEGVPYIRVQNLGWGTEISSKGLVYISEETNKKIEGSTLHPGDVLFAKTGATIGKTGIIPEYFGIANTTSHVGKITVAKNVCSKFIMYILASTIGYKQFWDIASQKTTRPELAINEIKAMKVLVPSNYDEQREIADYLDKKCAAIDALIEKKLQFIDELTAYKKSLIYEYVTGKKEVSV